MSKLKRHSKIIEIIGANSVETQEELAELLKAGGFDATQATVSRDIRELKLTKTLNMDGRPCYTAMRETEQQLYDRYLHVFREGVMSMDFAQNMLVITTPPGMANAVAAAVDSMKVPGMVGCIAGNDTIFCACKSEEKAVAAMNRLKEYIGD